MFDNNHFGLQMQVLILFNNDGMDHKPCYSVNIGVTDM